MAVIQQRVASAALLSRFQTLASTGLCSSCLVDCLLQCLCGRHRHELPTSAESERSRGSILGTLCESTEVVRGTASEPTVTSNLTPFSPRPALSKRANLGGRTTAPQRCLPPGSRSTIRDRRLRTAPINRGRRQQRIPATIDRRIQTRAQLRLYL